MRRIFLVLLSIPLGLSAATEETARIDLATAKKFAIERNFQVQALRREVEEKRAGAGVSRSGLFPKVGVAGGAEHRTGQSAVLGYAFLNWNIFRGFEDSTKGKIADLDSEIVEIRLRQGEFVAGLDVEELFHQYVFKSASRDLRKQALALNGEHRKMASFRTRSGVAAASDVMEFELREALLKSDLALINQDLEEIRIRIKKVMGEQVGSSIEPTGDFAHGKLEGSLMDYLNRVKERSAMIKVASRELAKANLEAKLWRAKWLPTVDLEAQAGYLDFDSRPVGGGMAARGTAVAKFNLFEGFRSTWERAEGEAKILKAEAKLKDAILTSLNDAELAYRRLKTIQERAALETENETRAERYYKAVVAEYKRGVKNSADVKVGAEMLYEARLRKQEFLHDFEEHMLNLERALGAPVERGKS